MEARKNKITYSDAMLTKFAEIGDKIVGKYQMDDETTFVAKNLIKWLIGDEFESVVLNAKKKKTKKGRLDRGIYIAGDCGTGKSIMLKILAKFAKMVNQKIIINGKEVGLAWRKFHARELSNRFRNGEDLGAMYTTPILQIDDLGAEPNPVQYMGNKVDLLSDILETREDNGCITLITSNLPPDYLSNTYNDRLESRMMALNYYELNGDDKRCI